MPSLPKFKKLVISGILSVFLLTNFLFVFTPSALAQAIPAPPRGTPRPTWYNQNFKSWFSKVYDSPENDVFGERYTAANVEWIIYGLFAFIINKFSGDPKATSCYMNNDLKNCISYLKNALSFAPEGSGGFAQTAPQGILSYIFLQDRPLSGITYFRNVARNWHLIPEAKAQTPGFGFSALNPVLPLWRASRNVAYAVLVFAIIILSFMIMFRVKINPQTVVTVQSAIPKVVFALILITFSYAIAGFMVDLMYVVIGLISLILSQTYSQIGLNVNTFILNTTPSGLFAYMTTGPGGLGIIGALAIYAAIFSPIAVIGLLGAGPSGLLGTILNLVIGAVLTLSGILPFFLGLIVAVLIILFIIIALRVVWLLLKTFVSVILLVAIAPLQISLGVIIPGIGFGSWLKSLISNLAVFPLAGLFLSVSFLFLYMVVQQSLVNIIPGQIQSFLGINSSFNPIQPQAGWPPLLSGAPSMLSLIYLGASLVVLAMLPKVSDIIKAVIEGKPFESGIGLAFGPVRTVGTGGLQYLASSMEAGQQRAFYTQFPGARTAPPVAWVNALRRLGLIK